MNVAITATVFCYSHTILASVDNIARIFFNASNLCNDDNACNHSQKHFLFHYLDDLCMSVAYFLHIRQLIYKKPQ